MNWSALFVALVTSMRAGGLFCWYFIPPLSLADWALKLMMATVGLAKPGIPPMWLLDFQLVDFIRFKLLGKKIEPLALRNCREQPGRLRPTEHPMHVGGHEWGPA